jgi:transposase
VGKPAREELEAENARLAGRVRDLEAGLAERDDRLRKLEELVERLQRRGKRQAAPFSKGNPVLKPQTPGRKSGGAHGRHGHRAVPARVDRELDAPLPGCCPDCGGGVVFDRWAEQFQTELPDPVPVVTRFRVGVGHCAGCRRRVQGRHPEQTSDALGAAAAQLGPHARALGHWLHYVLGLSFGKTSTLLGRLGVPVTAGALSSGAQSTGLALVPTTTAIRKAVASSAVVVMDETGWRIAGWGAWLWVATTADHTAYNVAWGRRFADATDLVPEDYDGTIARDGYVVYRNYTDATHQTCTAHLLRRCVEMIEADHPQGQATPRQVKTLLIEALAARELPEAERAVEAQRIGAAFDAVIDRPTHCDPDRRLVKHLANERHALLSFLADPKVDATNWRAEQAIRPAVVNRKVFGGNRTEHGAATQSRMMTYFRTAVQQGVDPIAGLVALARAPDRHTIGGLGLT